MVSAFQGKAVVHALCLRAVFAMVALFLLPVRRMATHGMAPSWGFVMLGVAYLGVMLAINTVMPLIDKSDKDESDETQS